MNDSSPRGAICDCGSCSPLSGKSRARRGCEGFVKPVKELKETVSQRRGPHKRTAIVLILFCVSVYAAMVNEFYFTFYFLQV